MNRIDLDFIKGIFEDATISGEEFIGAVEDNRIEFKPEIKGTLEKDVASKANLNQITFYIIGPTSEGGGKKDYISGFRDVKTEKGDIENKIEKLINPPHCVITPFIVEHEGTQFHQYKIEIWPSRDVCGIPGKTDSEGFLQVKYPRRYGSKPYPMTTAEANRVSHEKKIFRDAAKFYEMLEFKVEQNRGKIELNKFEHYRYHIDLFDYPVLDMKTKKAIYDVIEILGLSIRSLIDDFRVYLTLERIQHYHREYLLDQWRSDLKSAFPPTIDEIKFFYLLRDSNFIMTAIPEKVIQTLSFLEPYTVKAQIH